MRESVAVFGTDYATPDGTGVRDYIHVSDLAAAHVLTLEALIAEPSCSLTMNCGYGRGFSVLEVLDAVDRVTNRQLDRRIETRRRGRSRFADFRFAPPARHVSAGSRPHADLGHDHRPRAGLGAQIGRFLRGRVIPAVGHGRPRN